MYEEELPLTGAAVTIGGVAFNTWWIAVAGVAIVVAGTTLTRISRRFGRGKAPR